MKNDSASIALCILISSGLALAGCDHTGQWENEDTALLHQAVAIEQRHCEIKARIDSLWDATTAQLEQSLPPDFPAVDRDIFLKSRNADHMRMFMSFKKLDPDAQLLVNQAGQQDEVLAAQIHDLMEQKQAFEAQKNQFLQKVRQKDLIASRMYADQFQKATGQYCQ